MRFNGLSLTGTHDAIFNHLSLIFENDVKDIFSIFALKGDITNITGLPPDTLNTLQKLADALGDRPDFFLLYYKSIGIKSKHRRCV